MIDDAIDAAVVNCTISYACPCLWGPDDRYELLEGIGIGRSEVYRARDRKLSDDRAGSEVAIKIRRDRSDHEAKKARSVRHPVVVSVYDVGEFDGRAYIVSELVEGSPLENKGWREVFEIGAAVANGLAAIHAQGLVHGDIKPANILLEADGRPRLADFEMAVAPDSRPIGGTRAFMAPELADGTCTPLTDIYSLGHTLEQAISGPLPRFVKSVIRRATAREADRRYQSASELAFALRAALGRRARIRKATAIIVFVSLVVGIAVRETTVRRSDAEIAAKEKRDLQAMARHSIKDFAKNIDTMPPEWAAPLMLYWEWLASSPIMGEDGQVLSAELRRDHFSRMVDMHPPGTVHGALARLGLAAALLELDQFDEARAIIESLDPGRIPPDDPILDVFSADVR